MAGREHERATRKLQKSSYANEDPATIQEKRKEKHTKKNISQLRGGSQNSLWTKKNSNSNQRGNDEPIDHLFLCGKQPYHNIASTQCPITKL